MTASSDPFEALAETSESLVFVTDLEMRMLYACSMLERETGYSAKDFQFPQSDNPFIHREDADDVAEALAAFLTSDAHVSEPIVNRFLDRWGRPHRFRSLVSKIEFDGTPALLFVCRPVHTGPATHDDRQYRALVESADDAIVRIDNGGRLLFANRRTHELLGYTAVELGRLRLDDLVAPRDRTNFGTQIANCVGSTHPGWFELTLVAKSGDEIRVSTTLTSLGPYGATGELLAICRPLD